MREQPALTPEQTALKRATRRAVEQADGPRRAAQAVRVDAGRLSRYGNLDEPNFAPIDVAFALDLASGEHTILRAWAALAGFELVVSTAASPAARGLMHQAGTLAAQAGELVGTAIEAAADGAVSINEAVRIDNNAADVERAARAMRETAQHAMTPNGAVNNETGVQ